MMITEFAVDLEDILGFPVEQPEVAKGDILAQEDDKCFQMSVVLLFIVR